jgi:hypothetical protein
VVLKWSPAGREWEIAEHTCLKYSGRAGRAAFAKKLHEEAVRLAIIAYKWFFGTRFRRQAYAWHSSSLAVQS